jgi:hypothetical protein
MIGSHAVSYATQVIKLKPFGDGTNELLVHHAMDYLSFAVGLKLHVAIELPSRREPARITDRDTCQQAPKGSAI